ncbi:MAG: Calx-beta domain-containing protein, partial [Planctomycetes bacterium]|nr:Calx-beta domain-containing protein [Planctomycetota bacterium]
VNGTARLGNTGYGVYVNTAGNIIGGTAAGSGNLISGNSLSGLDLDGSGATQNQVQGNFLGTDVSGTAHLGNGQHGVLISNAASNNQIGLGGTPPVAGANTIAFNAGAGVFVASGTGNAILSNSIFTNGQLGIDLAPQGVTLNDSLGHNGANHDQNFPVIQSVMTSGGSTTIQAMLQSTPGRTFTVQFFASPAGDPSNYGQGQVYLGSMTLTTDPSSGQGTTTFTTTSALTSGWIVTATATDMTTNDTSEFSQDATAP